MLTRNFHQLQAKVQRHVAADHVRQGSFKTGVIGCLSNGVDNSVYIEREYGIPRMVSKISESIFDGLSPGEAASFFAALPSAIETDGKNLTRVGWKFLAAELRALPAVSAKAQAVVDPVIAGMDRLANGLGWPAHDAIALGRAAAAAYAYAAAYATTAAWAYATTALNSTPEGASASASAAAAAWAADAAAAYSATDPILARRRQRDTLLRLIKEAPMETN
jgi:hypothetical protein